MTPTKPRGIFTQGFIVQSVGLLIAVVGVWLLYSEYIRPRAQEVEIERRIKERSGAEDAQSSQREFVIILKDYEQQACLTLMVWASILLVYKLWQVSREQTMLGRQFVQLESGQRILPEAALDYSKEVQSLVESDRRVATKMLPQFVLSALQRFHATHSIQDSAAAVQDRAQLAADELDSDLSLVRYISWAIPSVGFIGTVRGIGDALAQADQALQGDLSGVTNSLGLAFNSTLIALVLSIVLMFVLHILQSRQEHLIQDFQDYCRTKIVDFMKVPAADDMGETFV
ncbi:MotA/TolQ/ExbB proton channel family protein [Synoicihabitans lomoniglobus]|uniref:MotA/TolQ/ExbB proton channel family protein n=1 Tax=Synoicihabitans lomoniglobus TaxID=2909285 RepID=A0AAF0CPK5_9BACT|nr:MotA/TolQ/ExbB proton channel family protein [Opitutaceae bacterium LMO-M01]WED65224.1 MotA/TolQ/ExbB proton channel family protein [Opitutaceae bacterium LMO-M01]